jgi:allantoinase
MVHGDPEAQVHENEFVLHSEHVVTPAGVSAANVRVRGRTIVEIEDGPPSPGARELGKQWLLPGLVDTHVHVNEPGRTEWEGFATATRAAAAGGITTIVDMPLNSVPSTTTLAALEAKRAAARGLAHVDCAFWGGVVPGNADELESMAAAGVAGFKCFLVPSGVDEFAAVGEDDLRLAMPIIARLGLPLLVHAEWPAELEAAPKPREPRRYAHYLATRPREAEHDAIRRMIRLCEATGCRVHIVHLASADAVPDLRLAKARGLPLTVETCPHYLTFAAEEIADGATAFKCAPPIRERENRERLWEALAEGVIDMIASDHSPCPPELKREDTGDFMAAWGGIASLEVMLAAVWTEASERGFTPRDLARWLCDVPATLAGFAEQKGSIAPGHAADLVAWDPDARWTVDAGSLQQRHPLTPWAGRTLRGSVREVFLRGQTIVADGRPVGSTHGELLARALDPSRAMD